MKQSIAHIALVVREYDEAIDFFTKKLSFKLIEDTYQPEQDKRWVVARGIEFVRDPKTADYGTVAVFKDLYGNLWDLIEYEPDHPMYGQHLPNEL